MTGLRSDSNRCSKCICGTEVPGIHFDDCGVCNYCRQVEELVASYGTGSDQGRDRLAALIAEIKEQGKGKQYDCVVGVSGGTDSSFLLMRAVDWGLRPLAVHYDNTWNSAIATENIRKVTSALGVDLSTHVLDNRESEDIYRSFLRAGVQEFDASTDLGYVQVVRAAANRAKVRYILEGHSFVAEGVSPLGSAYVDGGYIADVHRQFGSVRLRTYPHMRFWTFLKWILVHRQRFIRPLWYIDYSKEAAKIELSSRTGWKDYGGHHLENRATAFSHTVLRPQRWNQDLRYLTLSARVRAGQLDRATALAEYQTTRLPDESLVAYVKKRLALSDAEYDALLNGPKRTYLEFRNYKRRFELMRPLFWVLAKRTLVTMSFYQKYCLPSLTNNSQHSAHRSVPTP